MAIINTLLTITDNLSPGLNKAGKNVKDFSDGANKNFKKTEESANSLTGAFNNIKNFDTKSLDGFSKSLKQVDTQLVSAEAGAAKFLVRLGMLGGGMVLGAGLLFKLASASSVYVKAMREAAEQTGTNIETMQQMNLVFGDTGYGVTKYAELNKAAMDSMAKGFTQGTGAMVKALQAQGVELQQYNKYLNQADGGLNALIHTYYVLRDAGKSRSEIAQAMDSMASGASALIKQLERLKTEQQALTTIQETHKGVTEETARVYADFDAKVDELKFKFNDWKANALAPTVKELNNLMDILNGNWSGTNFNQWLKNFTFGGDNAIAQLARKIGGVGAVEVPGMAQDRLQSAMDIASANAAALSVSNEGGWEKPGKDPKPKKGAKDNSAAKLAAEQENARKWLEQIDMNNATEQMKAELNYKEQLRKLDKFLKDKAVTQEQYEHGVAALNSELQAKTIENTYQRDLKALQDKKARMLLTENEYNEQMLNLEKNAAVNRLDAQYYTEMEKLNYMHEQKLMAEDEFQRQLAGVQAKYAYDQRKLEESANDKRSRLDYAKQAESLQKYTDNMMNGINIANQFASAIQSQQEAGTAAWYASAIATKAMAVAQAIMLANLTASNVAATTPGIGAIAAGEMARNWGYANAAMIAGTGIIEIAGGRQRGGQVQTGENYLVGENGPELVTIGGNQNGQVTSNKNLREALGSAGGGGSGVTIENHWSIILQGSGIAQEDMDTLTTMIDRKYEQNMNEAQRFGGALYRKP